MTPTIITEPATQPDTAVETTDTKPTAAEVIDALRREGLTETQAGELLGLFDQLVPLVAKHDSGRGCRWKCWVDDDFRSRIDDSYPRGYIAAIIIETEDPRHTSLEMIMPDLAVTEPGSGTAHDQLQRHLLRPGDTFVHDFKKHCIVAVSRA
jgi:hypothetical protein